MTEQLVSFDTAKLAKEKGFKVKDNYLYKWYNELKQVHQWMYLQTNEEVEFLAPTQSLLQKWLREVHEILLWVEPITIDRWEFGINYPNGGFGDAKEYNTYEEALEIGLQEALKLIK